MLSFVFYLFCCVHCFSHFMSTNNLWRELFLDCARRIRGIHESYQCCIEEDNTDEHEMARLWLPWLLLHYGLFNVARCLSQQTSKQAQLIGYVLLTSCADFKSQEICYIMVSERVWSVGMTPSNNTPYRHSITSAVGLIRFLMICLIIMCCQFHCPLNDVNK